MPKEEWGTKRVCPQTGKHFYDLNKDPIVSPYTGEVVVVDNTSKTPTITADKADKASTESEELIDTDDVELDDDADIDIDDEVLDDDDDENVSLDEIADVPAEEDES